MTDTIVLAFPPPADPISMNQGDSWKVRSAAAEWRDRAFFAYVEQFPGVGPSGRRIGPSEVQVQIPFKIGRRRDPINYAKTVKHIVDGICMAGAWPDDTIEHVTQHIPILTKGDTVFITITPRP